MKAKPILSLRPVEFQILLVLCEGDRHGYAIMRQAEERSGGETKLEPGTLYRALKRLVGSGWVEEVQVASDAFSEDRRRRYYRITSLGRSMAAAEARRMQRLVEAARASRLVPGPEEA